MDDTFKIYVEQLREGQEKEIHESLTPDFLEVQEPDLAFEKHVELNGVAYLAEDELILHWDIETEALVPCSICNEKVPVEIKIDDFYHAEPLTEIKTGIFNFKSLLRDLILLEVPAFTEHNGNCPKRKEIEKYLKDPSKDESDEEGFQPFADLDWK